MCHVTGPSTAAHPRSATSGPAQALGPEQRQRLAVAALAGATAITELADHNQVSRRFVYRQREVAQQALANAFDPPPADDAVLFHLPVATHWIRQFTLGLVLIGHCALRAARGGRTVGRLLRPPHLLGHRP